MAFKALLPNSLLRTIRARAEVQKNASERTAESWASPSWHSAAVRLSALNPYGPTSSSYGVHSRLPLPHLAAACLHTEADASRIPCGKNEEMPASSHHQHRADHPHLGQPSGLFLTRSLYLLYAVTVCSASKQPCLIEQDFNSSLAVRYTK